MAGTALLVLALAWKGGHITGEYAGANRYQQTTTPTLRELHESWRVFAPQWSWSRELSPAPGEHVPVLRPEPEPERGPLHEPALMRVGPLVRGWVTHYGESYAGGVLGCGTGYYDPANPQIVAVGPSRYHDWPCGTKLEVCGPAGCILVTRHDACPGCVANVLDLSEAGNALVCGAPPHTCRATVQEVRR